jgi:redox-sensing transcriptional repressor
MNKELVLRLLKYKRLLQQLKSLGFIKVFSNNLGDAIGVSPALVRKDFSVLSLSGNKRGGYHIDTLVERLNEVLGKNEKQDVVLVGCGKIGTALMQYREFERQGIRIVAGFDRDPQNVENPTKTPVFTDRQLEEYVAKHDIRIAVVAVPEESAADVAERLQQAGLKGILNFAPVELKSSDQCIINNVNIGLELENLFFMVKYAQEQPAAVAPE